MKERRIPILNDKFDLPLFILLLKKSIWLILLILITVIISAALYLRYKKPIYESTSIIQLNEETEPTQKILQLDNMVETSNIANVIELLKSKEFLKRVFNKLPLKISYYNEGTFLNEELYESSPFSVDANVLNPGVYDIPIFIKFVDERNYLINYKIADKEIEFKCEIGQKCKTNEFSLLVNVNDIKRVLSKNNDVINNWFSFVINNPSNLYDKIVKDLTINVLNYQAQTISISYKDFNAKKTAVIVNTIAKEFIKHDIERKQKSSKKILAFIEKQTKSVYQKLVKTENQIHQFKKNNKIVDTEAKKGEQPFPLFTAKINELEEVLSNIEFEIITLKNIQKEIEQKQDINYYDILSAITNTKYEAVLSSIISNLQALSNTKMELLNDVTENNHKIKVVEKQINTQKQMLKDFINASLNRLAEQKEMYTKRIADYENKIFNNSTYNEIELARLNRLYSINEEFYDKLISKKAEYLISQAGFISKNEILELAQTPTRPISPIRSKVIFFFSFAGLLLLLVVVTIRYLLYNNITSEKDIESYTDAPIIGVVPVYKDKISVSQLVIHKKLSSRFAESFRKIRSNMSFMGRDKGKYSIAVSSTVSGEGKTFVALNLAGILAVSGKKVIIIDMDLRKPRIHIGFESDNDKGMSTILSEQNVLEDCIKHTNIYNIDYITAGPVPPNPSELTMSKKMDEVLNNLKQVYDIIIIDTSPIGLVTDALNVFYKADYPIYVVKAGYSKRAYLNNVNDLIDDKDIKHLSVILNGVELSNSTYGYNSYGYGYGYYSDDKKKTRKKHI